MNSIGLKLFVGALVAASSTYASPLQAQSLNQWAISCGVDKGAIRKRGRVWTFRTSANQCSGGSWTQRAEIRSETISPTRRGSYLFQTIISMKARNRGKFDIFQIHDGRNGCAPPLKVTVLSSGRIELVSEINKDDGRHCIRQNLSARVSRGKIRRDGTEQELKVLVGFDGNGGFVATVWIDGKIQTSGHYERPAIEGAYRSKYFYFKHGVYSPQTFTYEMVSRGMKVSKVRVK